MKYLTTFILAIVLIWTPSQTHAKQTLTDRDSVLQFIKDAFQAQVSLSEKERSLEEIEEILAPFFTKTYREVFLAENLVEIEGKFMTLGSDAAIYYIPFFKYEGNTKIVKYQDRLYVYEYFSSTDEGPVGYESHYEGVMIEQVEEGLRVSEYLYNNIPEEVIELGQKKKLEKLSEISEFLVFPQNLFNRFIKQDKIDLFPFKFINNVPKKDIDGGIFPTLNEKDEIVSRI